MIPVTVNIAILCWEQALYLCGPTDCYKTVANVQVVHCSAYVKIQTKNCVLVLVGWLQMQWLEEPE